MLLDRAPPNQTDPPPNAQDYDTQRNFFHVNKPADEPPIDYAAIPPEHEDAYRTINYQFPTDFLRCKTMRTALVFRVGTQEVNNFRMIERHYFKNKLIRSYDFEFGFCIPNSTNSWEAIYPIPERSSSCTIRRCTTTRTTHDDEQRKTIMNENIKNYIQKRKRNDECVKLCLKQNSQNKRSPVLLALDSILLYR